MSGIFPQLEDGQVCRYPVDTKSSWVTRVNQFVDFTEQRWVVRQPLAAFVFKYNHISRADVETLRGFFETQKGMFDGFTIDFDGFEYQNMYFDQDEFTPVEDDRWPNRFSFSLKLKQARPNGYVWIPDADPVYPFIDNGIPTQRPWTNGEAFFTSKIDLESGSRYSYSWVAKQDPNTLVQLPLRRWEINYAHITHDEAKTIYVFFQKVRGRLGTFAFHDPELYFLARKAPFSFASPDPSYRPYANCRFDMDELNLNYLGPNEYALKVLIAEFNVNEQL